MSWQNEGKSSRGISKIRKRGCSSSSSSSLIQKYRFKRAILVGKRGGSSTPVPTWKTSVKSSPSLVMPTPQQQPSSSSPKVKEVSVSARKLAATLWEINKIPKKDLEVTMEKKRDRVLRSSQSGTLPQHLSDPSYSPISERMDPSKSNARGRRTSSISQKHQVAGYNFGVIDPLRNANLMEIEAHSRGKFHTGRVTGIKTRLKDVGNGLTTVKELVKVLNHIWGLEEQHSSSTSLFSALRAEIDRARIQVDQLIKEQRSDGNEIEYLMKHFAEEKAAWRRKERDRIRDAIACISEELEVEKKLRRQTERLNKKLGKELAETKMCLSEAMKELESEKRAKEILEQVCDELASGIGDDRAEVEEIKRESFMVREELEREREMLQLADVLREERVQMKLSEAKYHFEEKNAAVEKLRNELEAYLRAKKGEEEEENGDISPNFERIKDLEAYLKEIQFGSCENVAAVRKENNEGEIVLVANGGGEHEEDDSADSDLHSIELNMDNISQSYKWCYAFGDDDSRRVSIDRAFQGRKSIEKIQWGSICLGRGSTTTNNNNGMDSDKRTISQELTYDKERLAEIVSQTQTEDNADEVKRYGSIKSLRDHILSGSKMTSLSSFASPTRQWGCQSLPLQDRENQGDGLKRKVVENSNGGESRISTSSRQ